MTSVSGDDAQPTTEPGDGGPTTTGTPAPPKRGPWLRLWMVFLLVAVLVIIGWAITMRKDSADVLGAQAALATQWQTLPGPDDPTALRYTRCEESGDGQFKCVYKTEGRDTYVNIIWDGTSPVVKQLSGGPLDSAGRSSQKVALALAADDQARGAGAATYTCASSLALSPNGSTDQGGLPGFQCVKQGTPGLRFVQFSADGNVVKDFLVKSDSEAPSAAAPPAAN